MYSLTQLNCLILSNLGVISLVLLTSINFAISMLQLVVQGVHTVLIQFENFIMKSVLNIS